MPDVAFVTSHRQSLALRELAATLRRELELQDMPCTEHPEGFPPPRSDLVYVLLDPRSYVRLEGRGALPDDSILARTIVLGAERPGAAIDDDHLDLLARVGAVFDIDQAAVAHLHRLGIRARLLRPGYSASLDRYDADAERPIDVMFLGAHSLRRTEQLHRCADVLSARNCILQLSGPDPAAESPTNLGAGRWPLLAAAKVVVKLHLTDDDERLYWLGTLDAIHAGAVVVSEHATGITPLEPGRHLLVGSSESLPYVIDALLEDEVRLAAIREQAYERLRKWMPFALWAAVFRAAVVEILGRPPRAGASQGIRLEGGAQPPEARDEQVDVVARGQLQSARSELVEVRRQLRAVRRTLGTRPAVEFAFESPAWRARRPPRVSVVIAVVDEAAELEPTLDTLLTGSMDDYELVVVDRGFGDSSLRITQRWLRFHPTVPSRLIIDRSAQGLGSARNTGLEFTRAPACLVLDPECMLYPYGLERMADTLSAIEDAVAAYPIVEVADASDWFVDAGGDHLLNVFAWEPERLRTGNIVHAPFLIRADRLRALGGFTEDVSLAGFEDYALWCAIAERGWRAQLIPQILARRTLRAGSSVLATMRPSEGPATVALRAQAPMAMAGAFQAA